MFTGRSFSWLIMYLPLSAFDLRSVRMAEIRLDIGGRLVVVTKDMERTDCAELIERMAHVQFSSERKAIVDAAADGSRAISYARDHREPDLKMPHMTEDDRIVFANRLSALRRSLED
jgi:hypothetical protein